MLQVALRSVVETRSSLLMPIFLGPLWTVSLDVPALFAIVTHRTLRVTLSELTLA